MKYFALLLNLLLNSRQGDLEWQCRPAVRQLVLPNSMQTNIYLDKLRPSRHQLETPTYSNRNSKNHQVRMKARITKSHLKK